MLVGVGYTAREICDGQTLASPGRWPIDQRHCPESPVWRSVTQLFLSCASLPGTAELLPKLALGQVDGCPFEGCPFSVAFCLSARGVRPTLCAHATPAPRSYPRRKRWRRLAQADPLDLADASSEQCAWRLNNASVGALADKVTAGLNEQSTRRRVLGLTEDTAHSPSRNLVVASPRALRKDKLHGVVKARVLFHGTHGLSVSSHTRISDHERAPIEADIKPCSRRPSLAHVSSSETPRQSVGLETLFVGATLGFIKEKFCSIGFHELVLVLGRRSVRMSLLHNSKLFCSLSPYPIGLVSPQ